MHATHRAHFAAFLLLSTSACLAPATEADPAPLPPQTAGQAEFFFDWTELQFSPREHRARRERLVASLSESGGGLFVAPSRDGFSSGETFRQLDDFLYFTGLELPNSVLVVDADSGRTTLFVPRTDERFESSSRPNDFPGRPLATDPEIARVSGVDEVRDFGDFDSIFAAWVESGRTIGLNAGNGRPTAPIATGFIKAVTPIGAMLFHIQTHYPSARIRNAFADVAGLRMVKSPEEIALIRRACDITSAGIREAARHIRPGVDERFLEAELEAEFKRGGAQRLAFDSIIKSGPNSLWPWRILAAHYDRRNRVMQAGELVLFDVGCEVDHYASDIGRTFPVSGRFTAEQRAILTMETAVADAVLRAVRPGVTLADLRAVALSAIPDDHSEYMQARLFFGHHIGLYVGDPTIESLPLAPGMVFTIEPWYYNHDLGIAVFTEDVVLVTPGGVENLTRDLPRTPDELERMVGGA